MLKQLEVLQEEERELQHVKVMNGDLEGFVTIKVTSGTRFSISRKKKDLIERNYSGKCNTAEKRELMVS